MKKIICLVASIACLVNANAQNTVTKNLGVFTGIEVNAGAKVKLIQSDSNYILLSYKGAIEEEPAMKVEDGILKISQSFGVKITVYIKNITSIKVNDDAKVTCNDTLKTDNLTISVSDIGNANMLVHAKNVKVRVTNGGSATLDGTVGSIDAKVSDASSTDILVHAKTIKAKADDGSNITVSGTADSIDVNASDASRIHGSLLKAGAVKVLSTNGATVSVWAVNQIDANASDAGRISIKGSPKRKNISVSDGGSITTDDSGEETSPWNESFSKDITWGKTDTTWGKPYFDSIFGRKHHSKHNHAEAFIGGGFVTGGSNGATIRYGRSREFIVGLGHAYKFCKWNGIGWDIYYKSTDFYLAQNSPKTFPESALYQTEKVSTQNFGGLVYDRFYLAKKLFLDGGVYGDLAFHSKHITWDNNGESKTVNLSYVNPFDYGVSFHMGIGGDVVLYCNYRLSALLQNTNSTTNQPYPTLPAYTFGIILE